MWVWITQHTQPSKPPFNWQDREQVTPEMMEFICAAWENYDGSDAHDTPISHEEAVLAKHAVERLKDMERVASMARDVLAKIGMVR